MNLDEMSLEERVARWPKPWLEKSRDPVEQSFRDALKSGLRKGLQEGIERERALLRRQMVLRFGADIAERASETLDGILSEESFLAFGELIVRCETGSEFLARLEAW